MAYYRSLLNPIYDATITNGIATFDGIVASKPLVSLLHNVTAWQEGTGTPSPTNIRNIHGWDSISIGNTSDYASYFRGLLNGTYGVVDLGSLTYIYSSTGKYFQSTSAINNGKYGGYCFSTIYAYEPTQVGGHNVDKDMICSISNSQALPLLRLRNLAYDNATTFKTAMQGVYLIYELAKQTTPTITEQQFNTLCTAFDIEGQYVTVAIGQTIYGGFYNAITGLLTVTHGIATFTGASSETWRVSESGGKYRVYTDDLQNVIKLPATYSSDIVCNYLAPSQNPSLYPDEWTATVRSNGVLLIGVPSTIATKEDWLSYLSNNNLVVVYPLATPTTIQLSTATINTIVGEQNNVFASTGDVTECKYTKK